MRNSSLSRSVIRCAGHAAEPSAWTQEQEQQQQQQQQQQQLPPQLSESRQIQSLDLPEFRLFHALSIAACLCLDLASSLSIPMLRAKRMEPLVTRPVHGRPGACLL
ncbi:uncharacterized protein BO66DRAFT_225036 [Aspergillus aculeatinus CBS 121060]|uniref:Uncharacterized protein n=1 Tax=Aspergillus aculeatinus CBS 121060 TaxID=1448322 RepID=A0ACD1HIM7_9EURO|nr:hypothetical protein BO66DRAFT_225036 [Aspergillus aculeatinus CBS 121060]RAH73522.1 hypothetical protein BO66DRAFT_225036 [Aspergillus aculeatinus CBS 121060]